MMMMILEDKEEIKHFLEYARRESTKEEKEDLKRCLEFYHKMMDKQQQ